MPRSIFVRITFVKCITWEKCSFIEKITNNVSLFNTKIFIQQHLKLYYCSFALERKTFSSTIQPFRKGRRALFRSTLTAKFRAHFVPLAGVPEKTSPGFRQAFKRFDAATLGEFRRLGKTFTCVSYFHASFKLNITLIKEQCTMGENENIT